MIRAWLRKRAIYRVVVPAPGPPATVERLRERVLTDNWDAPRVTHGRHCPCSSCQCEDWDLVDAGIARQFYGTSAVEREMDDLAAPYGDQTT